MKAHSWSHSPMEADVAIVGAGPAGASAASHFARAGFRVLLIDQGRFPRDKVCGDFVGPAALSELDELGLTSQPTFRDGNRIRRGALYINGCKVVGRPFPSAKNLRDHGLCIPRALFDDLIVQAAVGSGAHLLEGTRVTGYERDTTGLALWCHDGSEQRRLRTRLLIGADGSSSLIAMRSRREAPAAQRRRCCQGVF